MGALSMGEEDAAVFLIQRGARITNPIPSCPSNLLIGAAVQNCAKVLQCLLKGETEATTSMNGFTGLHAAVFNGSFEAALFLLDYGFDMEGQDHTNGWTPLMHACMGMSKIIAIRKTWSWFVRSEPSTIVALLLERGADVNAIAPQSKATPLSVAIHYENFDVLALLLEHGVKIDIKSRWWLLAHAKDLGTALKKQDRLF
jgi:ankyrin repeat protein